MGPKMKHLQVIILTLVQRLPLFASQDAASFFVVTKNHCITNRTSAIVFNRDIDDVNENEKMLSRFYPPTNHDYDCNIEEGETCTEDYKFTTWKLQNSISGDIDEEIIDRRWEEFRLYKSSFVDRDGTALVYREAPISITKADFVIPLSLRLKNEGHVFLCEGSVTNSNCYWIMLQAWGGKTSAIRRCEANTIPNEGNKWPQRNCKTRRTDFNHTEDIMSNKFWTHLKIIKKGDTIAVKIRDQDLLTFTDDQPFSPRRVFFHSKNHEGLWKFHQYTYTYTVEIGSFHLGPIFEFRKEFNCLALFAVMCQQCVLEIELVNGNQAVHKERFVTPDEKWKEFKIIFNLPYGLFLMIYYNTTFQDGRPPTEKFWAIDSVRQCENNEYRILESFSDNVPCQLVASNDILTVDESGEVSDPNTNCSERTFGENCLPCSLLARQYDCPSLKYCEAINNRRSCHCTAGFRTDTCSEGCPEKYYGQGCKKHCKYCSKGCNNIDGICIHGLCKKGFSGEKCDIPPASLLKYAPEVTDVKLTSCLVFIKEFEIIGDTNDVEYFRFEHKKSAGIRWIPGKKKSFLYQRDEKESITNLEANTEYCVRAVLFRNSSNIYLSDAIQEKCFHTCINPNEVDAIVVTSKDEQSISLRWQPPFSPTTIFGRYKIKYNENEMELGITRCKLWKGYHCVTITENIKENDKYEIELYARNEDHGSYGKILCTPLRVAAQTAAPDPPYDFTGVWTDKNDLNVSWKHPNQTNGKVTKFTVDIANGASISFLVKIKSEKDYNLTYTYTIDKNHLALEPCKKYDVSVTVYNEKYSTKSSQITVCSPPPTPHVSEEAIGISQTETMIAIDFSKLVRTENGLGNCSRNLYILFCSWNDDEHVNKDREVIEKALEESLGFPVVPNVRSMYSINQESLTSEFSVNIDTTKKYQLYLFFVNECFGMVRLSTIQKETAIFTENEVDSTRIAMYTLLAIAILLPLIPSVLMFMWKHVVKKRLLSLCRGQENKRENDIPLRDFDSAQPSTSRKSP